MSPFGINISPMSLPRQRPFIEEENVVYWFEFNERAGNIRDLSNNERIGTLTNDPTWTNYPGGRGMAVDLDGSNDYIDVGEFSFIPSDPKLTFLCKVNIETLPSAKDLYFLSRGRNAPPYYQSGYYYFGLQYHGGSGNHFLRLSFNEGGTWRRDWDADYGITPGEYFFAGTYNSDTDLLRLYRDGEKVHENTITGDSGFSDVGYAHTNKIGAGVHAGGSPDYCLDGQIRFAAIINRDLSEDEILLIHEYLRD